MTFMSDNKKKVNQEPEDKLNLILDAMNTLAERISSLDNRISKIEEKIASTEIINEVNFEGNDNDQRQSKFNFNELDKHLRDTYDILSNSNKPMTASDVAERRGLSRSTISYHLNQLVTYGLASKDQGRAPDSKKVFFQPKDPE